MDKQIRKIERETSRVQKDLKHLEKADKKRDRQVKGHLKEDIRDERKRMKEDRKMLKKVK